MPETVLPLLSLRDVCANYGPSRALHGVTLDVHSGELVTLVGRNGAGKTTTLKAIAGLMRDRTGSIAIGGAETIRLAPEKIARLGAAYCPEERGIFASLSVEENLLLPPVLHQSGYSADDIYQLFPRLYERRSSQGTKLSGGEQQILAIARILRTGAKLLLLDEPTEGLAPVIVDQIGDIVRILRQRGFTILLVEQNFEFASQLADRIYVVENGRVVEHFSADEARSQPDRLRAYLSV
ncbi:ABC transporter ATP-binding protein [Bradyrhizobium sp. LHD-71]|uniref:ABC transporter ATP-binding protein n=1 Tax=Bradyrhizobium sp. LHD-71 TaxID=3072141 RepID=UPI00280F55D5|nr:ABC transporter ATP-binding protein [Bradyrhizobium sp. LHD-71]MDQ8731958.1 ABC transporter ATP-binding protein [Bradyrhizobium sp. LHD-71]